MTLLTPVIGATERTAPMQCTNKVGDRRARPKLTSLRETQGDSSVRVLVLVVF